MRAPVRFMARARRDVRRVLSKFISDDKAVAAVEFALLLPFMALLYFGSIEVSFLIGVDRRVTATTSTVGDLVARTEQLDQSDTADIFRVADALFQPYNAATARVRVTSLVDDDGAAVVNWSQGHNTSPLAAGSTVTVDAGLLPEDGSLILAEVTYAYTTGLGYFLQDGIEVSERFFLRPRQGDTVEWVGPAGANGSKL